MNSLPTRCYGHSLRVLGISKRWPYPVYLPGSPTLSLHLDKPLPKTQELRSKVRPLDLDQESYDMLSTVLGLLFNELLYSSLKYRQS